MRHSHTFYRAALDFCLQRREFSGLSGYFIPFVGFVAFPYDASRNELDIAPIMVNDRGGRLASLCALLVVDVKMVQLACVEFVRRYFIGFDWQME